MKNALRQERINALIYSNNMGQGLLGWATFPWSYASNPKMDGIVILFSSVPWWNGGPIQPRRRHSPSRSLDGACATFQAAARRRTTPSPIPAEKSPAFGCPTGRQLRRQPISGLDRSQLHGLHRRRLRIRSRRPECADEFVCGTCQRSIVPPGRAGSQLGERP